VFPNPYPGDVVINGKLTANILESRGSVHAQVDVIAGAGIWAQTGEVRGWRFHCDTDATVGHDLTVGGDLSVEGFVTDDLRLLSALDVDGRITADDGLDVFGGDINVAAGNVLIPAGMLDVGLDVIAAGSIYAHYIESATDIRALGDLYAEGNVTAGAEVRGETVYSNSTMHAVSTISSDAGGNFAGVVYAADHCFHGGPCLSDILSPMRGLGNDYAFTRSAYLDDGAAEIAFPPAARRALELVGIDRLKIQLTAGGPCRGLYVASRSPEGFVVRELNQGRSSVDFDWEAKLVVPRERRERRSMKQQARMRLAQHEEH